MSTYLHAALTPARIAPGSDDLPVRFIVEVAFGVLGPYEAGAKVGLSPPQVDELMANPVVQRLIEVQKGHLLADGSLNRVEAALHLRAVMREIAQRVALKTMENDELVAAGKFFAEVSSPKKGAEDSPAGPGTTVHISIDFGGKQPIVVEAVPAECVAPVPQTIDVQAGEKSSQRTLDVNAA